MKRPTGLVSAVRTLTIFSVPGRDAGRLADSLPWFPFVGALIGVLLVGLALTMSFMSIRWPEGMAVIVVAGSVWLTRGLHLDGLADCADGFGGGFLDKARTLDIMRDPRIGAFGVVALVVVLLSKWAAVARLAGENACGWIVMACVVSRTAIVDQAIRLPYARTEDGTAGPFVKGGRPRHLVQALLFSLLICCLAGPAGMAAWAAGMIGSRLLGLWYLRRVGGVTGDLLGASCEIIETALLLAGASVAPALSRLSSWRLP